MLLRFLRAEDGQTLAEYAMLLSTFAVAGISGAMLYEGGIFGLIVQVGNFLARPFVT